MEPLNFALEIKIGRNKGNGKFFIKFIFLINSVNQSRLIFCRQRGYFKLLGNSWDEKT